MQRTTNALQKYGQPEDIAKLVSFLVSEDAGFITGERQSHDRALDTAHVVNNPLSLQSSSIMHRPVGKRVLATKLTMYLLHTIRHSTSWMEEGTLTELCQTTKLLSLLSTSCGKSEISSVLGPRGQGWRASTMKESDATSGLRQRASMFTGGLDLSFFRKKQNHR